jgi:hypothetical protein
MRKLIAILAVAAAVAVGGTAAFAQTQIAAMAKTPSVQNQVDWFGANYRGDGG